MKGKLFFIESIESVGALPDEWMPYKISFSSKKINHSHLINEDKFKKINDFAEKLIGRDIINSIDYYLSKGMYNYEIYNNLKKIFGIPFIEAIGKNRINEICNDMRAGFNSNISLVKEVI